MHFLVGALGFRAFSWYAYFLLARCHLRMLLFFGYIGYLSRSSSSNDDQIRIMYPLSLPLTKEFLGLQREFLRYVWDMVTSS